MGKKIKSFLKNATGKGFYLTAAICLCLIAGAVGMIYRSATNMIKDYVTSQMTTQVITEQAEAEKDDEPDPRTTSETKTTSKQAEETSLPPATESAAATEEQTSSFASTSFIYPVTGEILKDYSDTPVYDETMDDWRVHRGIDILCDKGASVCAVGNGKVTKVYSDTSYGYCIEIDHGTFTGRYCGLEQGTTVSIDAEVSQGDLVGLTGDIYCESAQQEHFHFEAIKNNTPTDPVEALR